jgi:hypothetical protein
MVGRYKKRVFLENITRRQNMTDKMNENFSASWYANNTKNKAYEIIVFKKHYNYTVTIRLSYEKQ